MKKSLYLLINGLIIAIIAQANQLFAMHSKSSLQVISCATSNPYMDLVANEHQETEEALVKFFTENQTSSSHDICFIISPDRKGYTPLHIAVRKDYLTLANAFFDALTEEQKNSVLKTKESSGNTILLKILKKLKYQAEQDKIAEIASSKQIQLLSFAKKITQFMDDEDFETTDEDGMWRPNTHVYHSARTYYNTFLAALVDDAVLGQQINPAKVVEISSNQPTRVPSPEDLAHQLATIDIDSSAQTLAKKQSLDRSSKKQITPSTIDLIMQQYASTVQPTYRKTVTSVGERALLVPPQIKSEVTLKKKSQPLHTRDRQNPNSVQQSFSSKKKASKPKQKQVDTDGFTLVGQLSTQKIISAALDIDQPSQPRNISRVKKAIEPVLFETSTPVEDSENLIATNPLDEVFKAIAAKKIKLLETSLTKHKKALSKAAPWQNAQGKTLLYCALECNFISGAEALTSAIPALVKQGNADGSQPIDYVLEHNTNTAMHTLFSVWTLDDRVALNLDASNKGGSTLRSRAEKAGFLQTKDEIEAYQATAQSSRKKKSKARVKDLQAAKDAHQVDTPAALTAKLKTKIEQPIKSIPLLPYATQEQQDLVRAIYRFDQTVLNTPSNDALLRGLPAFISVTLPQKARQQILTAVHPYYGALIHAAHAENIESIIFVLGKIDDMNVVIDAPFSGQTLLTYILRSLLANKASEEFILKTMAALTAHPNIDINKSDLLGTTALHIAAYSYQSPYLLKLLLSKGANPVSTGVDDCMPLDYALVAAKKSSDLDLSLVCIHTIVTSTPIAKNSAMGRFSCDGHEDPIVTAYLDKYPDVLSNWALEMEDHIMPAFTTYGAYHMLDRLCATNPELIARILLHPFIVKNEEAEQVEIVTNALHFAAAQSQNLNCSEKEKTIFKRLVKRLLQLAPISTWLSVIGAAEQADCLKFLSKDEATMHYLLITQIPLKDSAEDIIQLATNWEHQEQSLVENVDDLV